MSGENSVNDVRGTNDVAAVRDAYGVRGAGEDGAAPAGARWLGAVGLSVVVPGPVPQDTLTALRDHLDAHSGTGPGDWELLVVAADDGPAAADGPAAGAAPAAAAAEPRIRLVRPAEGHRGKGAALRAGVLASAGDRVLLTDAALTTPLDELARLQELLDEDADAGSTRVRARARA